MTYVKYSVRDLLIIASCCLLAMTFSASALADRGLQIRKASDSDPLSTTRSFSLGQYRAIIIGNNQYNDITSVWKPLNTAIRDAESVAKVLKTDYGFSDVVLMRNATRRQILLALNDLRERVTQDDSVILYYAGHGYMDPNTKEAYWIPVDAQGWDDSFFLSNSRIKEKLATLSTKVKHTLIVSDSCFSGTLLRGSANPRMPKVVNEPYYRKIGSRKSVQIMAAGGEEFVDDNYRGSGHSPYTYFFLKQLKRNDQKYMTVSELGSSIARLVANNVRQTPQYGVLYGAGDEGGEFVFKKSLRPESLLGDTTDDQFALEVTFWERVEQMAVPEMYLAYLEQYPQGYYSELAKNRVGNRGGRQSESEQISQLIGTVKLYLETKNLKGLQNLGVMSVKRQKKMATFFNQYNSFDAKITDFTHVSNKQKAQLTISLVNLVDSAGRRGAADNANNIKIEIHKNKDGRYRIYW